MNLIALGLLGAAGVGAYYFWRRGQEDIVGPVMYGPPPVGEIKETIAEIAPDPTVGRWVDPEFHHVTGVGTGILSNSDLMVMALRKWKPMYEGARAEVGMSPGIHRTLPTIMADRRIDNGLYEFTAESTLCYRDPAVVFDGETATTPLTAVGRRSMLLGLNRFLDGPLAYEFARCVTRRERDEMR